MDGSIYKEKLLQYLANRGMKCNLDNPQTIQEKVNWLKIYDSTPLKTRCADKVLLHDYAKEKIGEDICIPIIKTYDSVDEINWGELPESFVIKCNHGSAMNIVVKDKSHFDKADAEKKLRKWMQTDFAFVCGYELHYHNIKRKILVEEYKKDKAQEKSLYDYKFWCFNGKPQFMTINDGMGHGSMGFFDMNFKKLDVERVGFKPMQGGFNKPSAFGQMVEYAKKLSADFKFVRVDFYYVNGKVYLGELTFTPGSGFLKYKDPKYDKIFGDMLDLGIKPKKPAPSKKINFLIVHYNTPLLTECLVRSINKFTPNSNIYVFDNSDKFPFVYRQKNLVYYDNTKGQIINFDAIMSKYPNKNRNSWSMNKCGSAKHCITIQKCIEMLDENFILLDADTLIKKDLTPLFDESKIFVGEVGEQPNGVRYNRVFPWLCFINTKMMKQKGIKYFNDQYMLGLGTNAKADRYDTGAYFFMVSKNLPNRRIKCGEYITHFGSGSWGDNKTVSKRNLFLDKNFHLYSDNYKEKIIVTMTSWKERVGNLKHVISTILKNTMLPDKLIINLSAEEFPGKEAELPADLVDFIKNNSVVSINWIAGKNTKQWKKIIPTLLAYPKDAVICIDDDRSYPTNFIQVLYETHLKHPNFPVTVNQGAVVCGMKQHCGHGTLDKLEYYGGSINTVANDVMDKNPSSDTFFSYMCKRTGREILSTGVDVNKSIRMYNEKSPLHKSSGTYNPKVLKEMVGILDDKFGLSFSGAEKEKTGAKPLGSGESAIVDSRWVEVRKKTTPPRRPLVYTNSAMRSKMLTAQLKSFLRP